MKPAPKHHLAVRRMILGALFGLAVMLACTLMTLFEGPRKATEFGIASGALTVVHLSFAIFSRQIVSGLRGIPWIGCLDGNENEAGVYAAQFGVGITMACAIVGFALIEANKAAGVSVLAFLLIALAYFMAIRRQRHQAPAEAAVAAQG